MNMHYGVTAMLALFSVSANAADYDGHWFAQVQVGADVVDFSLTIGDGEYVMAFGSSDKFHRGAVEFTAPDTLRLIVQEYEPTEYQGQPIGPPPNSSFTIIENNGQALVLLDNLCALYVGESSCTTVWERQ